ncbi:hypothetical protein ACTJKC_15135 [Pedobacter sp. 22226]|uniref:hypothetical protein n=1 Tax=Pedobacter sp. 22226 TaxID=3453894 RepID=UPI003F870F66
MESNESRNGVSGPPQMLIKGNTFDLHKQEVFVTIGKDLKKILAMLMYLLQLLYMLLEFKALIPKLF